MDKKSCPIRTTFLFEQIDCDTVLVETADELVMISTFNNLSIFEDNKPVGIEMVLETIGNDKTGSTCYNCLHGMLNFTFCYSVHIGVLHLRVGLEDHHQGRAMEINCFDQSRRYFAHQ